MANLFGQLVRSAFDLVGMLGGVATGPISAILLVVGGLLIAVSVAIVGVLALGAVLEPLRPESLGRPPRQPE